MAFRLKLLQIAQRWGIPLLLLMVAGRQIILTHTVGLSPWHGGGFGMFASIDRDERRLVRLDIPDCQGGQRSQVVSPDVITLSTRDWVHFRTLPNVSNLRVLGEEIKENTPLDVLPSEATICGQSMELQVWRLHFSQASEKMWYAPISPAIGVDHP